MIGISVAAMTQSVNEDPVRGEEIMAQAKVDVDDGRMRAGDFTDNTYMKKAEEKYYRIKNAKEAAKNGKGGRGAKILALHGGADEEDEHESDIGNIKNFILTWRDALMRRKVFETEDIRHFIGKLMVLNIAVYIQSIFSLCSVYIQSMFSVKISLN